jgi:hypothetical protein
MIEKKSLNMIPSGQEQILEKRNRRDEGGSVTSLLGCFPYKTGRPSSRVD